MCVDDHVLAEHVSVEFTRSVFGTLAEVTALDGEVFVNGQKALPGDILENLTMPLDLGLGDAVVRIDRPSGSVPAHRVVMWLAAGRILWASGVRNCSRPLAAVRFIRQARYRCKAVGKWAANGT